MEPGCESPERYLAHSEVYSLGLFQNQSWRVIYESCESLLKHACKLQSILVRGEGICPQDFLLYQPVTHHCVYHGAALHQAVRVHLGPDLSFYLPSSRAEITRNHFDLVQKVLQLFSLGTFPQRVSEALTPISRCLQTSASNTPPIGS